jgi:hypothetical protein
MKPSKVVPRQPQMSGSAENVFLETNTLAYFAAAKTKYL